MRLRIALVVLLTFLSVSAFSKDVYLSIGGSVGAFKTDLRIFNPSTTKDIQVLAYLLPVGNVDNSGVTPKTITVPKRQMAVYDDVLTSLFQSSGLAGIRLSSADDFVATQRIYAVTASGTLGQFVPGLDSTQALKNGVVIQLKSNTSFRTNLGFINPNNATANTTWYLYDKNNALITPNKTMALPPLAVISPQEIKGFFGASADLSDSWVAYTSDQPIIAYGSVIDNGTTDPTYITASNDSGAQTQQPASQNKVITVLEKNGSITASGQDKVNQGDKVDVQVTVTEGPHGFALVDPDGIPVIPSHGATNPGTTYTETFTVAKQGTYAFYCTNSGCSAQHASMSGTLVIGTPSDNPYRPGY